MSRLVPEESFQWIKSPGNDGIRWPAAHGAEGFRMPFAQHHVLAGAPFHHAPPIVFITGILTHER